MTSSFGSVNFRPREAFVATWDSVGYYEERRERTNTFQIVLASDDASTYAIFLYPEGGVQWIKAEGKNKNMADAK